MDINEYIDGSCIEDVHRHIYLEMVGTTMKKIGVQYFRAFACITVLLSHLLGALPEGVWMVGNVALNDTPLRILWGGYSGVIIFFVISGFFSAGKPVQPSVKNYGAYVLKRHLRIYPAYLLMLIGVIMARATAPAFNTSCLSEWISKFWSGTLSLKQCLMSLFLVSTFDADALNPVVWTLRIEMRMCFFLPLAQWLMKRWNTLFVCCLCIVLGAIVPFFAYLPVFSVGMVAYQYRNRILNWMRGRRMLFALLAFVLMDFSCICKWLGLGSASFIQNNVTALGAAVMLLCVYEITVSRSCLEHAMKFLGDRSYHISHLSSTHACADLVPFPLRLARIWGLCNSRDLRDLHTCHHAV